MVFFPRKCEKQIHDDYRTGLIDKNIVIIIMTMIMTLLDNTITGRTSSSHCGPLKLQIQIAKNTK